MYSNFQNAKITLSDISLDVENPRLVTLKPLKSEGEIIAFLFAHEDLASFVNKIANEGLNPGAERPFVVASSKGYTVIEGNTRIAAYKLLTGTAAVPKGTTFTVPGIGAKQKAALSTVDCAVAPTREALLPIMADAHFGLGDKSKWGYLGSRKAVYDEWRKGHSVAKLAQIFNRRKGQVRDLILEYELYLAALGLDWGADEQATLEDPAVKFNPPIRFLQTQEHKDKVGIELDREALSVKFDDDEAKQRYKHVVKKLVIHPEKGLGATATFEAVFKDYKSPDPKTKPTSPKKDKPPKLAKGALFNYPVTVHSQLLERLMEEAKTLNCAKFPASGTFLLRNIVESLLKQIIKDQNANKAGKPLDLEGAIILCTGAGVTLLKEEKSVLAEFRKSHLNYLNLGSHGNVIPNESRLMAARDAIDVFVKNLI